MRADPRWHRRFFAGVALEFWERCATREQTRREADFLEAVLRCRPPMRLLDVPCGTGRHARELAARGYAITGVDASAAALAVARARTRARRGAARWVRRDMRRLGRCGPVEGAYCFGNSFGYLPPRDMQAFLGGVARALLPGRRFVAETGMAAESILPALAPRESVQIGDILLRLDHRYLPGERCLETRYTFVRGRRTESRTGFHWVYTTGEIRGMLEAAGLRVIHLLGGLDRSPYRAGDGVLYVVAMRAPGKG